ncbi:MAG: apolipoprotein N-acyltransferase [Candidatus Omnitrophota bacterium]
MAYILLSIISGLLTGITFNFPSFSLLAWFSLVPFLYVIAISSYKKGLIGAFAFGISYYGSVLFWVANVSFLGLLVLLSYLCLFSLLFYFIAGYFITRPLRLVSLACAWVLIELLKENIWCGFGWGNMGYSQYNNFLLIQPADAGGAKLISFFIVTVNTAVLEIIFAFRNKIQNQEKHRLLFSRISYIVAVFSGIILYSSLRIFSLDDSGSVDVTLIQPNIAQEFKWQVFAKAVIKEKLFSLAEDSKEESLVIFPEAAWPDIVNENNLRQLNYFVKKTGKDSIFGAVKEENDSFYNSAFVFDKTGALKGVYRKVKLVPFGEYVPLRKFLGFIGVLNSIGDIESGKEFTVFDYNDRKFSVLICFEDIFPDFVRNFSKGRDFLVNITNDAWFAGNPEALQHLGIMTLRAVENRIPLIRCANTGISGWVSSRGEIEIIKNNRKEVFFDKAESFRINLTKGSSFYRENGELFAVFCGVALFVLLLAFGFRGSRQYQKTIREVQDEC